MATRSVRRVSAEARRRAARCAAARGRSPRAARRARELRSHQRRPRDDRHRHSLAHDRDRSPHREVGDDDVGPPLLADRLEIGYLIRDRLDEPVAKGLVAGPQRLPSTACPALLRFDAKPRVLLHAPEREEVIPPARSWTAFLPRCRTPPPRLGRAGHRRRSSGGRRVLRTARRRRGSARSRWRTLPHGDRPDRQVIAETPRRDEVVHEVHREVQREQGPIRSSASASSPLNATSSPRGARARRGRPRFVRSARSTNLAPSSSRVRRS